MVVTKKAVVLVFLLLTPFCWAKTPEPLVVASALWPPNFVNEAGDGIYQQILREIYPNYALQYVYTTYARSKHMVSAGKADLWLVSYIAEEPWALYPKHAHDADLIAAVHLKETPWQGISSLTGQPVSWISEYGFEKYLPQLQMQYYEVPDLDVAIKILLAGRIHYVLDDIWGIEAYLQNHPDVKAQMTVQPFALMKLYPAFKHTDKGRRLAKQWDKAMARLIKGRLQTLYRHAGESYLLDDCTRPSNDAKGLICLDLPNSP